MKKNIILLITVLFALGSTVRLYSLSYNFAFKNWITFNNSFSGLSGIKNNEFEESEGTQSSDFYAVPSYTVSPSFNIRFDNTNSFAFNCYTSGLETFLLKRRSDIDAGAQGGSVVNNGMDYNYLKVDADFLLNKRIDDRLSVYMGAKSLFMHSSGVYEMSGDADNTTPEYSFNQYSYGPGLGFGYNHPLDEVNFIIFGLSEAILNTRTITYTDSYTAEDQVEETAGNYIVTSTTVKASYAHFDRSTLITYEGGIQYQHLYYMHISGNDSRYNKEQLHYVGPVFNIIYSF